MGGRQEETERRVGLWLRRWTALMGLVLIAATWRLWLWPWGFPAIPVSNALRTIPLVADCCLSVVLSLGLGVLLFGGEANVRKAWLAVLACGVALVALDQHRLQPWFYQLLIFAAILGWCDRRWSYQLLRWIVISIYFYSALGKFDAEFLHTVGQQFWRALMDLVRFDLDPRESISIGWISVLPLSELLLAAGLSFRLTRRVAGLLACAFHATLMLVLGPLGLDHSAGVVLWNFQLIGQAALLFVWLAPWIKSTAQSPDATVDVGGAAERHSAETPRLDPTPATENCSRKLASWGNLAGTSLAALVMFLPLGERFGFWDHWTSWALYAPHSSRAEVWIASTVVDRLPESLRRELADASEATLWMRLPIERWSLAQTGAPIYPQARFQLGVARALAEYVDSETTMKVVVRGVARRWDGRRVATEYQGKTRIAEAADRFWLNTAPRAIEHFPR